jgi:hypothetical protein
MHGFGSEQCPTNVPRFLQAKKERGRINDQKVANGWSVGRRTGGNHRCAGTRIPKGMPHMDHVFVIMMENHGFYQVINNPNEPYLNSLISGKNVNLATNYFAVGHPSLTNYLEVVGGSNFGIRSDNPPAWGTTPANQIS